MGGCWELHWPPLEYLLCAAAGSAETDRADLASCVIPGVQCPEGLKELLVLGKGSGLALLGPTSMGPQMCW